MFSEFSLIAHLVSIWPSRYLKLSELISNEIINLDILSKPLFSCGPTILDYVLLGILISRPCSRLKVIDFTGFHKDLKLTRDISHLSLLWFKPSNRTCQNIQEKIKSRCSKFTFLKHSSFVTGFELKICFNSNRFRLICAQTVFGQLQRNLSRIRPFDKPRAKHGYILFDQSSHFNI